MYQIIQQSVVDTFVQHLSKMQAVRILYKIGQIDNFPNIQGAAEKSNPLTRFANSLATDYNFLMKLCIDIVCSYLHETFKCYLIILKYDKVM